MLLHMSCAAVCMVVCRRTPLPCVCAREIKYEEGKTVRSECSQEAADQHRRVERSRGMQDRKEHFFKFPSV